VVDREDRRVTFKVRIVERKCIGAGQCVLSAPAVFDQDDDGIVVLRDATPPPSSTKRCARPRGSARRRDLHRRDG
jgi:ferredoxin